jgi:arylsulfatase A-like enzyme
MKQRIFSPILLILGLISVVEAAAEAANRPNILLIAVDDMGYSDIGPFGSEIRTPSIDALAQSGLKFTNFYVGPSCSPTRSMLFSGNDNHVAGLGNMGELLAPNQVGKPGYEGHLNNRVVSIATLMKTTGYHTYRAGKWHLGHEPEQDPSKRGSRIAQGAGWAQASSTPFHLFKNFLAEGGIRSPLIISGPGVAHKGEVSNSVAHVMDIAPTLAKAKIYRSSSLNYGNA